MRHEPEPAAQPDRGPIPGPSALQKLRLLGELPKHPHECLLDLAMTYGDIVLLKYPRESFVLLAKPEYIEHVLHHRHQLYDKQTPRWHTLRQIWGNGLLTADGDVWRRQRQRMQPAFHQDCMQRFGDMVAEEAQRMAGAWAAAASRHECRDVYRDMLDCAVRALSRATFGSDVEGRTDTIIKALDEINAYINPMSLINLLNPPLAVRRLISPDVRRFQEAFAVISGIFDDIIRRRMQAGVDRTDLLGMIMYAKDDETSQQMTVDQLRDEMMIILMAGHETTGIAMAWSWHWLAKYPDAERQFHDELDAVLAGRLPTFDDLGRLEYTKMVFQESMRLAPPIWGFDRRAREDDSIDGYRIPRGTYVATSPYVMHRHPRYWERPDEFDPRRFLPDAVATRPQYAFFPFGGGPRRCIGLRFAFLEAQLILATLAQSFVVRPKPGHPVEAAARLNLPPKYGLQMFVERRLA
jgi:cytochrome P450